MWLPHHSIFQNVVLPKCKKGHVVVKTGGGGIENFLDLHLFCFLIMSSVVTIGAGTTSAPVLDVHSCNQCTGHTKCATDRGLQANFLFGRTFLFILIFPSQFRQKGANHSHLTLGHKQNNEVHASHWTEKNSKFKNRKPHNGPVGDGSYGWIRRVRYRLRLTRFDTGHGRSAGCCVQQGSRY